MRTNSRLVLAIAGVLISTYLPVVQFGVVATVWDPIFGAESRRVLQSEMSRWLTAHIRVPDAALGAGAYLLEALLLAGSGTRSRLLPLADGLSVILVAVSLGLVAVQAFLVHAWCTLCLSSAALSVAILLLGREA